MFMWCSGRLENIPQRCLQPGLISVTVQGILAKSERVCREDGVKDLEIWSSSFTIQVVPGHLKGPQERESERSKSQRKRERGSWDKEVRRCQLLALRMGEATTSWGMQAAPGVWRELGRGSPWHLRETQPWSTSPSRWSPLDNVWTDNFSSLRWWKNTSTQPSYCSLSLQYSINDRSYLTPL